MIDFEIVHQNGDRVFIRVLDLFTHRYTGETMRRIRIESIKPYSVDGVAEYRVVNESEFEELLKRRRSIGGIRQ